MKTKRDRTPEAIDESTESEITIQPDGRIFAFGITQACGRRAGDDPDIGRAHEKPARRIAGLNAESANVREPLNTKENHDARAWRNERTPASQRPLTAAEKCAAGRLRRYRPRLRQA